MDGRIPMILDGGPCNVGLESTVLTLCTETPRILRPGGITPEMIAGVIGRVDVDGSALKEFSGDERTASPGMKYRHYAPKAAVTVVGGNGISVAGRICNLFDAAKAAGRNPTVLAMAENLPLYSGRDAYVLGVSGSVENAGFALFEMLRRVDADGRTDVFAEAVEPVGLGLAIMNRLLRAAGFNYIRV